MQRIKVIGTFPLEEVALAVDHALVAAPLATGVGGAPIETRDLKSDGPGMPTDPAEETLKHE